MDPTAPYTDISVLLGDESSSFRKVSGSIPPMAQNGNLYSRSDQGGEQGMATADHLSSRVLVSDADKDNNNEIKTPENVLLAFPIHARWLMLESLYFAD